MSARKSSQPFSADPDNRDFSMLVDAAAGFGMAQQDIARILKISPGQISRVLKGERRAARRHVRNLLQELKSLSADREGKKSLAISKISSSPFSIDHAVLRGLSPAQAIEAFRDLLWARASDRRVPTTEICISGAVSVADGGVDASIRDGFMLNPPDDLLAPGTRFQVKTGNFEPWRVAVVQRELFGNESPSFDHLGSAVKRCLRDGRRFVLVCFGVDPVDEKRRMAESNLTSLFKKCGFPNTRVAAWGLTDLIGLFNRYPSLCMKLRGHDHAGLRSRRSWEGDADMQPRLRFSPEQDEIVSELRNDLNSGRLGHLRLIGEPGVGKTRFALEVTRSDDLTPLTLYVKDSASLLRSSLINELAEPDSERSAILVVDECPPKDRAEIWNVLRSKSDRVRLITIDHGPDDSTDDKMQVVTVEPASDAQIVSILEDHEVPEHDAKRWAEFCQGCPRVAHILGENLHSTDGNLLRAPAFVDVWDRFIVGKDQPDSEEVILRRLVLRYIALFDRFGYQPPVENEAHFIAVLAQRCDSRLTWRRFQSIVAFLKKRRILQGETTLYITPRLLQIHLGREFWELHGNGFDIARELQSMPAALWHWFVQMLRYTNEVKPAERAIEKLLGPDGKFRNGEFPNDRLSGNLLRMLSETTPRATLHCLERTIGNMTIDQLRLLTEPRHSIVSALEILAVWEEYFDAAVNLLFKLAESENTNYINNAVGILKSLFILKPGMAPTRATPDIRLAILKEALNSKYSVRRRLALDAAESALCTSHAIRFVGPEHQGLRPTVEFWMPQTYGELWSAYRDVWEMLVEAHSQSVGEDRGQVASTLVASAWSLLHIEALAPLVVQTLESLSKDSATDMKSLVEMIKRQLRHPSSKFSSRVKDDLMAICMSLEGVDFASRLQRLVRHSSLEDYYDSGIFDARAVEGKVKDLAIAAMGDRSLLPPQLPWLICEDSNPAFLFGFFLASEDQLERMLPLIMQSQREQGALARRSFLTGYLHGIFRRNSGRWESIMLDLRDDPAVGPHFSDFAVGSGVSDAVVKSAIDRCRLGLQCKSQLGRWGLGARSRELSRQTVEEIVRLQLDESTGTLWCDALQMCDSYFLDNPDEPLPENLIFTLLTHSAMSDGRIANTASYSWSRLAEAFLRQFPERVWEFFVAVLRNAANEWSLLLDLNTNEQNLLTTIVRSSPEMAWGCITDAFKGPDWEQNAGMQHWLEDGGHRLIGNDSPGPIALIPWTTISQWVDENIDDRACWVARILPKTLDNSSAGRMTRSFIQRYCDRELIADLVNAHFHSRGWCGKASDRFRGLRNEARSWLAAERDPVVRRWLDRYIDGLSSDISRQEIDEERRF